MCRVLLTLRRQKFSQSLRPWQIIFSCLKKLLRNWRQLRAKPWSHFSSQHVIYLSVNSTQCTQKLIEILSKMFKSTFCFCYCPFKFNRVRSLWMAPIYSAANTFDTRSFFQTISCREMGRHISIFLSLPIVTGHCVIIP